jgi:hypothetical protein
MFEVGCRYTITMSDPSQPGTVHYIREKVTEFQFPLLKLDLDDRRGEKIINTASSVVISAERERDH